MLTNFQVAHLEYTGTNSDKESLVSNYLESRDHMDQSDVFVLNTCQRFLVIAESKPIENIDLPTELNLEVHNSEAGYQFLLQVICGLKSKVIAESEIVKQFKDAYSEYLRSETRNPKIIRILEKLFKDSKEVRTNYLKGVGQKTYAAITRKILLEKSNSKRVLVIGSGNLAIDVVNQVKKHFDQIYVTGRNRDKIQDICHEHLTLPLDWKDFNNYTEFSLIVNTIGTDNLVLFQEGFFTEWDEKHSEKRVFVDLGHPSIISTKMTSKEGVIRLKDIFEKSVVREKERVEKIEAAKIAIGDLSAKRLSTLKIKGPELA